MAISVGPRLAQLTGAPRSAWSNLGQVMRRERQSPLTPPLFPYMGWMILGRFLVWAGVELNMFQRLLDTVSLSGPRWASVIGLSLRADEPTHVVNG